MGLTPVWVRDGAAALAFDVHELALVVLDLMLPGAYGLDVLRRIRSQSDVPVLVLSARNESIDKVRALRLGADDFVTKPFWPDELVERIKARLRRPVMDRDGIVRCGPLMVHLGRRRVEVNHVDVELSPTEYAIIAALARRPGEAISRTLLIDSCLAERASEGSRSLDAHVSRIRRKLGSAAECLATAWGVGYRLQAPRGGSPAAPEGDAGAAS